MTLGYTFGILLSMTDNRHRCISKEIDIGDSLNMAFVVTGDDSNERTRVTISDPDRNIIYQKAEAEEGDFVQNIKKQGRYVLCFYPSSDKPHFISFEFYSLYEKGHIINLAKDGNFN
jgi:hypothetical protein